MLSLFKSVSDFRMPGALLGQWTSVQLLLQPHQPGSSCPQKQQTVIAQDLLNPVKLAIIGAWQ